MRNTRRQIVSEPSEPLDLAAVLSALSPAQKEHIMEYGLSAPADTSGRMPAKKVCTQEYEQY